MAWTSMFLRAKAANMPYSSSALSRSDRMARSTPGYCTLTATSRPSGITALWTWPMDAAALGIGSQSRNSRSGSAPSSSRMTRSARLGAMGGTSAWRVARAAWASGGSPSAMNDTIWPAFMMAPFMFPRTSATSCALRMAKVSSSRARCSSGPSRPRTFTSPRWRSRRTERRYIRTCRSTRLRRPSSARAMPAPMPATATPAAAKGAALRKDGRACRRQDMGEPPGLLDPAGLRLLFGLGLVLQAEAGSGKGLQAGLVDAATARLTDPVGAVAEPGQGVLDVRQLGLDVLQDGQVLLPLEGLGAHVGLVLVHMGQLAQAVALRLVALVLV